eukprot:5604513-Lingulodinium_polyedra.AAC.1
MPGVFVDAAPRPWGVFARARKTNLGARPLCPVCVFTRTPMATCGLRPHNRFRSERAVTPFNARGQG